MALRSSKELSKATLPNRSIARPLQVGEHVACTLLPDSTADAIAARVVALDEEYINTARLFKSHHLSKSNAEPSLQNTPGSSSRSPPSGRADSHEYNPSLHLDSGPQRGVSCPDFFGEDLEEVGVTQSPVPSAQKLDRHLLGKARADVSSNSKSSDSACPKNPILVGRVYVTFPGQDHRLDRWEAASGLQRVPPPKPQNTDEADENGHIRTRAMKRARDEVIPSADADIALDRRTAAVLSAPCEHATIVRNISQLFFGHYQIECWYYSPFLEPYNKLDSVYVCDVCLRVEDTPGGYRRHLRNCQVLTPPGIPVYEDKSANIRVYEVDPYFNQIFCANLSCVAKLFLEHKSLCFDIIGFYYYVLTLNGEVAGYFSKEKPLTGSPYNVACILTFPHHQRKGIGRFLIDFSYELTRREGKVGTPERPLSDLGQLSYRRHWTYAIFKYLQSYDTFSRTVPVTEIESATGICGDDIVPILKSMNLLHIWKGVNSAKVSKVDLESAKAKCSPPPIPVESRYFMNKWRTKTEMGEEGSLEEGTTTHATAQVKSRVSPPSATREFSREFSCMREPSSGLTKVTGTAKAKKSKKKGCKSDHNLNGTPSELMPLSPPLARSERKTSTQTRMAYTDDQLEQMRSFILKHTPEAVSLKHNMAGCVSAKIYRDFSNSIGLSNSKCRKKMRKMAEAICLRRNDGTSGICWYPNRENLRAPCNRTSLDNGHCQNSAEPASAHKEVGEYESDELFDGSRASGSIADADLNVAYDDDDEDMEEYSAVDCDFDAPVYLGESCDKVSKAPEKSSRVEFVETKEKYGGQENGQMNANGNDVVVID